MTESSRKPDRRIQRTRTLLRNALMALIVEQGYENITVQEIADKADVARATFYLHYKDKEELLLKSMEEIHDELVASIGPVSENFTMADGNPVDLIAFQHVAEHAAFYRVMLSAHGPSAFIVKLRHYLVRVSKELLVKLYPEDDIDPQLLEIILHSEAGSLMAVLSWWLENDMPLPAAEMARLCDKMGAQGVIAVMDISYTQDTRGKVT
ncbi:MAG: TetR/AcrR family transcriptional regulator [Chitinophagaceae bacterium]|nr:TetR/AcrR family transcriptional regulator [Anaerolineae bacterium]